MTPRLRDGDTSPFLKDNVLVCRLATHISWGQLVSIHHLEIAQPLQSKNTICCDAFGAAPNLTTQFTPKSWAILHHSPGLQACNCILILGCALPALQICKFLC